MVSHSNLHSIYVVWRKSKVESRHTCHSRQFYFADPREIWTMTRPMTGTGVRNRAPKGRNETGVWRRRHDEYEKSLSLGRDRMQEALVVRRETHIPAPPAAVFALLTDPEKILRWIGTEAQVEPEPGGLYLVNVTGAQLGGTAGVEPGRDRPARAAGRQERSIAEANVDFRTSAQS
jgi:hypothetical protein